VFYELCHSCGGCVRFCPENAISEVNRKVGVVLEGNVNGITCIYGKMNIGEARPSPIIRAVKDYIVENKISIIDVPPGTSCPVVESIISVDYCILVTEPTPFGLSDLMLAVELVKKLNIPMGVVINRSDIGNEDVRKFCIERGLEILMEIPYHKEIAENYSKGFLIVDMYPHWENAFLELFEKIKALLGR
jgi:MinD superfamily P-loop ATPase